MTSWMRRWRGPITVAQLLFFVAATTVSVGAQDLPGMPPGAAPLAPPSGNLTPPSETNEKLILLNFRDSPLDQVLEFVADLLGRTLIKSPGINATVTLKSQTKLTVSESLQAIEAVLAMNNVTLVPMGEKFLKVVQTAAARQEAMPLRTGAPEEKYDEDDELISQVITLKYIEIAEAQPIIQSFIHGYGKIQALERTNSLLITDTAGNLNRIQEILEYIDQPAESAVETRIYELRYAEAGGVAGKLNELIADSQAKEEKPRVDTGQAAPAPAAPPGIIRAARTPGADVSAGGAESAVEQAERGIIRGKVKIIADDRTNILFVISRPENFAFFDKIVAVLDRPIEAEIGVRVVPLEYAKAEEVAGILNEFIGAAASEKKEGAAAADADGTTGQGSQQLDQILRATQTRLEQAQQQIQQTTGDKSTIGRLSASTRILADKRTNSLLLMGRKSDLDALEIVLDSVDIMLAQVLLETVIIEVTLGDSVETGFAWLQRSITAYNETKAGPNGGVTVRTPSFSFGGASIPRDGSFRGGDEVTEEDTGGTVGALTYFLTIEDLNIDAIIRLAAQSSDARVISTPVILTTDNTEAKIVAAEQRPVVTSSTIQQTGQNTQNFEYRNIGITIIVTPRINPSGFVMMEISQNADEVLSETQINNTTVPIIGKRELSAQVGVQNRQTVVLGGLVRTDNSKSRTKIPILGDIPLLGALFRSDTKRRARSELLVLITPYVLKTPQEALDETQRLYSNSKTSGAKWHTGWSDSVLPQKKLEYDAKARKENFPQPEKRKKQTLLDSFGSSPEDKDAVTSSRSLEEVVSEPSVAEPEIEIAPPAKEGPLRPARATSSKGASNPDPNEPVPAK